MKQNIIAIDVMGGDNAPYETIKGSIDAINENKDIKLILVGKEDIINQELQKYQYNKEQLIVQNATQVIETTESPTSAIREKKDSSIVVGLKLLKEEKAKAFVSAGSTGALLTGATVIIKRIKGVERPALATLIPNANNGYTFLIDSGANMDCKPSYLPNFAKMGKIYMENIMKINNPKVAIVNVGSEKEKGDTFTKEAYELLEQTKNINFVGNIEGREIPAGEADIVVCDGFVGNVILKLSEGIVKTFSQVVKKEITSNILYSIGGVLSKGAFKNIKKKFDYAEVGGAPFLGLKSLVVKAHGSSNAKAIKSAINQCYKFIESDIATKIENAILEDNNL
ncbi:phosphate acyltransferase PlsX [uncultured Tyzzerella sp.]|uniref:phosphate acyltransferase PlsX n=1 Tax=uncultured Tyzzerella sp. TaxID=2321398 RepID=UPI002942DF4F|nr:phosphate acyltransferase PlsX [uncultured Tyzzerella sp.]